MLRVVVVCRALSHVVYGLLLVVMSCCLSIVGCLWVRGVCPLFDDALLFIVAP